MYSNFKRNILPVVLIILGTAGLCYQAFSSNCTTCLFD